MNVSSTGPRPASTAGSNRRRLLILLAVVVVGLSYGVFCMFTYNPNYVTGVDSANRIILKSGDGVVLVGVDCPPVEEKQVGEPADKLARALVLNRYIRVETDVQPRDSSGWIQGYIFVEKDGQEVFLNEALLRQGLGRAKPVFPNLKYRGRLEAAEAEAKSRKIGLWSPDYKPSAD